MVNCVKKQNTGRKLFKKLDLFYIFMRIILVKIFLTISFETFLQFFVFLGVESKFYNEKKTKIKVSNILKITRLKSVVLKKTNTLNTHAIIN